MKIACLLLTTLVCCLAFTFIADAQSLSGVQQRNLIFSMVKGQAAKPDTLSLAAATGLQKIKWISGDSSSFSGRPMATRAKNQKWVFMFHPSPAIIGLTRAVVQISNAAGKISAIVSLTGLQTKALEGENEPTLASVVNALGYHINIGWTTLANHSRPELQGDELPFSVFRKAANGKVEMMPVARYSPDFELPFGYYINDNGPVKKQAGILAKAGKYPEHQTLFPSLAAGVVSFDPGKKNFGFYTTGPTHSIYSEDVWNMLLYPENAVRGVRIFPVKDLADKLLKHTYLVCFEEAKNGDYNDYVFLVKNAEPVTSNPFTKIFNGKNLGGWHTFIKGKGVDTDPESNFSVEDSALHVIGKDLGYAITRNAYHNFHFKVDFKWGEKKWPPRENAKRDAGICYNIPVNEPDSIWPVSIECQVQEGDVGDFWLLGFSTITVDGKVNNPSSHTQVVKKKDGERRVGEWNTVEVISYNGTCVHIVNGLPVNYGTNASVKDGRILLQSEYSEVFYRNVQIREL